MSDQKGGKAFALIGGLVCTLILLIGLGILGLNVLRYGVEAYTWNPLAPIALVINLISWLILTVSLFIANRPAALAAVCAGTVGRLLVLIADAVTYSELIRYIWLNLFADFFSFLSFALLAVLLLLSIKKSRAVNGLWFVPAVLMLLCTLLQLLIPNRSLPDILFSLLTNLLALVAVVLTGLWAKESALFVPGSFPSGQPFYPPQPVFQQPTYQQPVYQQPTYQQPVYQQRPAYPPQPVYSQQPVYQQPAAPAASGGAEKLRELKGLLDAGIITQEEFDQKKARILDQL